MECKVSDFSLLHKALQILCKRIDCDFIDLPIRFEDVEYPRFQDGFIVIKSNGNLLDTMASSYSVYVNSLEHICGRNIDTLDARHSLTNLFLAMIRDFKTEYGSNAKFDKNESFVMKLDQFHMVWILLKNIFCPYKNLELKNVRVVARSSSDCDAVVCSTEKNRPEGFPQEELPCLFINLDIEKNSVRSAFLLVEALRAMMEPIDSPEALIREVFSNFFMRDRVLDYIGMCLLDDSEVANFLAVLSILCQSKDIEEQSMVAKKTAELKTAQSNPYVGNWWFMGLTEKMLDSARGADWSTTKNLKDFSKDLWDKVEDERKRRHLVELPFELLLRVQSRDLQVPPNQTLQELLSKTRIW